MATRASVERPLNAILRNLPDSALNSIAPDMKEVDLAKGAILFEPDTPVSRIYFPIDSVISFMGATGSGGTIEVWSVGNEGIAGISGILGKTKPFRGVVQMSGRALVSSASSARRHFQKNSAVQDAILAYCHHLLLQISLLGICNTCHPIEQRFCRWLMMIQDRARTDELKFTQETIAAIMGTRRATISVAAAALQVAGMISYTPGSITIRSRKALEKTACACYRLITHRRH